MLKPVGGGGEHNGKIKNNKLKNYLFEEVISLINLFKAWREFKSGKMKKKDVREFTLYLEDMIFQLHEDLKSGNYRHSHYTSFFVRDPKLRHIHKACVRDRLLHHAIVRVIEPIFEKSFIFDSYSSRKEKGTHKAIERFKKLAWRLSQNNTKTVWILKCDIRKFFDSVDHCILLILIKKRIKDGKLSNLLENIIISYNKVAGKGIPLGNLTSQLFSNIYLDELDQFLKRRLRVKNYLRYADDFMIIGRQKGYLEHLLPQLSFFLENSLKLDLHPDKISIRKWHNGADWLGCNIFPQCAILRTKTKKRIINKMEFKKKELADGNILAERYNQSLQSYLGVLSHCQGDKIRRGLIDL